MVALAWVFWFTKGPALKFSRLINAAWVGLLEVEAITVRAVIPHFFAESDAPISEIASGFGVVSLVVAWSKHSFLSVPAWVVEFAPLLQGSPA